MQSIPCDIHYELASKNLPNGRTPQFYLYQETTDKNEHWKVANTKLLRDQVRLHSALAFTQNPMGADGNFLAADVLEKIPRHGGHYGDIDCEENPAAAIEELRITYKKFVNEYGVDPRAITTFISGKKGGGLFVDSRTFGEKMLAGHPRLADFYKSIAEILADGLSHVDTSIYNKKRGRLVRRLRQQRENGLYRTAVSAQELLDLPNEELLRKCETPGPEIVYPDTIEPSERFSKLFEKFLDDDRRPTEESRLKKRRVTKAPQLTKNNDSLPVLNCIDEVNSCDPERVSQAKNFNELTYLAAKQLFNAEPNIVEHALMPFLKNWRSGTYPTEQARKLHLHMQIKAVSEQGGGRACHAIRKSLPKLNCVGCPHFLESAEVHGDGVEFENSQLSRVRFDSKSIRHFDFVANFFPRLEVEKRQLDIEGASKKCILEFSLHLRGSIGRFEIDAADLHRKDVVLASISNATKGMAQISPYLWHFILPFAMTGAPARKEISYETAGWHGPQKFVTPHLVIEDGKISSSEQSLVSAPSTAAITRVMMRSIPVERLPHILLYWFPRILKFSSKGKVTCVIAFCVNAITSGFVDIRAMFFLNITGPSGVGKSSLVRAVLLLLQDTVAENSLTSAAATAMSIEVNGSFFKDLPFPIDDVKLANISNLAQFRRILQNACDAVGRGRLDSDAQLKATAFIRGKALLNGEDSVIGNEPSLAGRSLELQVSKVPNFSDEEAFLIAHKEEIAGILPHFIADLQKKQSQKLNHAVYSRSKQWFSRKLVKGENRDRVVKSAASLMAACRIFYGWINESAPGLSAVLASELKALRSLLLEMGNKQIQLASQITPAQAYLSAISEALASNKCVLAAIENADFTSSPVGIKTTVGYERDDEAGVVFLIPQVSLGIARDVYLRAGLSLDFSLNAIARSLEDGGHIVRKNRDRNTVKIRLNTSTIDTWAIKRESIFPDALVTPKEKLPLSAQTNIFPLVDSNRHGQS